MNDASAGTAPSPLPEQQPEPSQGGEEKNRGTGKNDTGTGNGSGGSRGGLVRSTAIVSAATTASRFLGLIREQMFAALIGAGFWADAFVVAFRIPNLLRDLFAEGALSAAFVPTFAKAEKERGEQEANALANKVVGALLFIVGALTLLGILFADQIVVLLASGFSDIPGKKELTARLARIMMPFLPAISFAAVMMGMLNARRVFGAPALAPALFNLTAIGVGAILKICGAADETAVTGWSIGTLLGGVAQFAVQLKPLSRFGYRFRPVLALRTLWQDKDLRHIAFLMGPAILGLAATEANIFINTQFASQVEGANAWLNYAFRIMYLPIGIFGVAVATVTTSSLAQKAAENDLLGMKKSLSDGIRLIAFLSLPSMAGLFVLSLPVIQLIYRYGRFTDADALQTARALQCYAVGLFAYSSVKVTAPAFYALSRPRIPLLGSVAAVATNLVFNLVLFHRLGFLGLALGTALGSWVNFAILSISFARATKEHPLGSGLFSEIARTALAALLMGLAVWGTMQGLPRVFALVGASESALWARAVKVILGVTSGVITYGLLAFALRLPMLTETIDALRRKLARRRQGRQASPKT